MNDTVFENMTPDEQMACINETYRRMSFNEQMAYIDEEVQGIIDGGVKTVRQQNGRAKYGNSVNTYAIARLFDIIKADPKNQAVLREVCQAEKELIAFLYDEPDALSTEAISAYWRRYTDAYVTELEQACPPHFLVRGSEKSCGEAQDTEH